MSNASYSMLAVLSVSILNLSFLNVSSSDIRPISGKFKFTSYKSKKTITSRKNNRSRGSLWRRHVERRDREVTREGAVNNQFCSLIPDDYDAGLIWNDMPIFMFIDFQENIRRVELYSSDSLEKIWHEDIAQAQKITQNISIIPYTGEPLQEGKVYYYSIRTTDEDRYPLYNELIPITIIPSAIRSQIQADLNLIEQNNVNEESEELGLAYIEYFIDEPDSAGEGELFLDAIQQLVSLPLSIREPYLQVLEEVYCDLES